ncbi:MAG: TlyA family RNA methyltransferase [Oscillospiraceae bacterium]
MSKRLDVYLVENGYAQSRERAKNLILSGNVFVNDKSVHKASVSVSREDKIDVLGKDLEYVGRGALKLKYAFECFDISVRDKICADIGASTGGFTQIMLENGAEKVYAVDVGHDQLAEILKNDRRVVNCEGINVRNLTKDFFEDSIEFMAADLSFISLKLVVPVLAECLCDNGDFVALIKPQFEAGKQALNKKGLVRGKKDHIRVLIELTQLFKYCGFSVMGLNVSAIKGGDGNIEYIAHLKKSEDMSLTFDINEIVNSAFR